MCDITRQDIQGYVARLMREGYAPKSIDQIHDVLSAVLRTAVKWGHLPENSARGVELPTLKGVRPRWALTPAQAAALLERLPTMARAMVGLTILSGLLPVGQRASASTRTAMSLGAAPSLARWHHERRVSPARSWRDSPSWVRARA